MLPSHGIYMNYKWRPGRTGSWIWTWILLGNRARAQVASVLPVLIKDRSLHWIPSQITYILSRAHTYLWEREDLLLSYHGLWLFPDRLIGGGDRSRSKHHFEGGPQVWGLGVQVWMGTWTP
jgi:hypothetical protein